MDEQEWLASTDPAAMLRHLQETWTHTRHDSLSDRKLRLFACACCRLVESVKADEDILVSAEQIADGLKERPKGMQCAFVEFAEAQIAAKACMEFATWKAKGSEPQQAALLRDIIGNPLAPVTLPVASYWAVVTGASESADCAWLTPTILRIATMIYEERLFDIMPMLADALEDAGCPPRLPCYCMNDWCDGWKVNPLIHHLRCSGPHVRGCWVIDLILGKE